MKALKRKIQENKLKTVEVHEYEGVGHAFLSYNTEYFDEEATEVASESVRDFVRKNQEQFDACLLF